MLDPVKNFAISTVATAPSPATSGTSLVLASGGGALFPNPSTDGDYNVVIKATGEQATTSNSEIVRVTAKSTDTLTIDRQQEGTSARTIIVGDDVYLAPTAKTMSDIDTALIAAPIKDILFYTANSSFAKADYSGANFILVIAKGGGGGGGGIGTVSGTANSGGGGEGETVMAKFLISELSSTEAIVIGAGGAGGIGNNTGSAGANTTFGSTKVIATGGSGGSASDGSGSNTAMGGDGGAGGTGDLTIAGASAVPAAQEATARPAPGAGNGGGKSRAASGDGFDGIANSGGGGAGARTTGTTQRTGGAGGSGYMIIHVY